MGDSVRILRYKVQAKKFDKGPSPCRFCRRVFSQEQRGNSVPYGMSTFEGIYGWCIKCYGANAKIDIITPEGIQLEHSFKLGFKASNNETEYEALLAGLRTILGMGVWDVEIYSNSWLVISQVQGIFEAQNARMKEYLQVARQVLSEFSTAKVAQVVRGQNKHADSLATLASLMTKDVPWLTKVELIAEPCINTAVSVGVAVISMDEPCWMNPIIDFLAEDRVSDDEKEANRVRQVAARYRLSVDRKLYRKSFRGPYLLCLHPKKVNELLAKLYDEVCDSHVGGRSLAHRAMTQGF